MLHEDLAFAVDLELQHFFVPKSWVKEIIASHVLDFVIVLAGISYSDDSGTHEMLASAESLLQQQPERPWLHGALARWERLASSKPGGITSEMMLQLFRAAYPSDNIPSTESGKS